MGKKTFVLLLKQNTLKIKLMWREKHGNIYITTCKIDCHWEFAVLLRELKTELCNNLERWYGEGGGREV